ncbi:hypothetical protein ACTRXD_10970 [Nitrospira sp. T9]|uniref:hypothetical protein n=1 Tax=unclassified Nitrospira TaxID=2652172 RepID=UPI003F98C6C5
MTHITTAILTRLAQLVGSGTIKVKLQGISLGHDRAEPRENDDVVDEEDLRGRKLAWIVNTATG